MGNGLPLETRGTAFRRVKENLSRGDSIRFTIVTPSFQATRYYRARDAQAPQNTARSAAIGRGQDGERPACAGRSFFERNCKAGVGFARRACPIANANSHS